jgi:hypothetical protein
MLIGREAGEDMFKGREAGKEMLIERDGARTCSKGKSW